MRAFDGLAVMQNCKMTWDSLDETDQVGVRHCRGCKTLVHRVLDRDGLEAAVAANLCIAVQEGERLFAGKPEGYEYETGAPLVWE